MSISKPITAQGKDVITTLRRKSNRVIKMPKFLCGEMRTT